MLKPGGWVWIAEVRSRFAPPEGGSDEEGLRRFVRAMQQVGFDHIKTVGTQGWHLAFGHPRLCGRVCSRLERNVRLLPFASAVAGQWEQDVCGDAVPQVGRGGCEPRYVFLPPAEGLHLQEEITEPDGLSFSPGALAS